MRGLPGTRRAAFPFPRAPALGPGACARIMGTAAGEACLLGWREALQSRSITVASRLQPGFSPPFPDTSPSTLPARWGIPEPTEAYAARTTAEDARSVDLVLVPGLAFDARLRRLGRGKGYYGPWRHAPYPLPQRRGPHTAPSPPCYLAAHRHVHCRPGGRTSRPQPPIADADGTRPPGGGWRRASPLTSTLLTCLPTQALALEEQLLTDNEEVPTAEHDCAVHCLALPSGIVSAPDAP